MFVTQCVDSTCLCREKRYQKSLFQCLYAQCDRTQYGPALAYTISACIGTGADINMVSAPALNDDYLPSSPNNNNNNNDDDDDIDTDTDTDIETTNDLLRAREADYLAGRDTLPEIPGLNLRQVSAPPAPPMPTLQQPTATPAWGGGPGGGGCGAPPVTRTATVVYTTTVSIAYVPSQSARRYGLSENHGNGGSGNGTHLDAAAAAVSAAAAAAAEDATATTPMPTPLFLRPWMVRESAAATSLGSPLLLLLLFISVMLLPPATFVLVVCAGVAIWAGYAGF
ncbi:hypothetical protein MGN70_013485 [Eutypa lata]|nr:hypothetical protein MGN70_013485 [Eutypa lata]